MMRTLLGTFLVVLLAVPVVGSADAPPQFLLMWGSEGSGIGQFENLYLDFIALDQYGNVYIPDFVTTPSSACRIQVFDAGGRFVRQLNPSYSAGGLWGITVDSEGEIVVTNSGCNRVERYDNQGNFLRMWGWGVEDGSSTHQICTSGCQCGIAGAGDGQLSFPQGDVSTDADGNVYVADRVNERVVKYDDQGNFLLTWGWGVQNGASVFQVCTSGCQAGLAGTGNGQFDLPTGIDVLADTVYVSDWNNDGRVQLFSLLGTFKAAHVVGYSAAGVDVSPDGDIYVTRFWGDEVVKLDSSGTQVARWGIDGTGPGQFDNPYDVAVAPGGNVYVLDKENARVQKFGPPFGTFKADLPRAVAPPAGELRDASTATRRQ